MLARLAHFVARHRWPVIGAWVVLTLFGGFAAGQVSKRWYQSFSIPGKSAYEASQRTLKTFGIGVRPPDVVVFHTQGDATQERRDQGIDGACGRSNAGRTDELVLLDRPTCCTSRSDRHTTFEEIYPPGIAKFDTKSGAENLRAAAANGLPPGRQCR